MGLMGAKPFATTTEASAARIARENNMVDLMNFFVEHQQECQTEERQGQNRGKIDATKKRVILFLHDRCVLV